MNTNNRDYGTTTHKGKIYTITCEAWIDNKGTEGDVVYYAYATNNNKKYKVMWYTTAQWDKCSEVYNLEQKLEELLNDRHYIVEGQQERIEELQKEIAELESQGYNSFFVEDASGACDWENANEVWEVEMD